MDGEDGSEPGHCSISEVIEEIFSLTMRAFTSLPDGHFVFGSKWPSQGEYLPNSPLSAY
jgi:hypothetical protein